MNSLTDELTATVQSLARYCERRDWKGYDPYDGLNAPLFQGPLFRSRAARLLITQSFKHLPVNLRPLVGIQQEWNPKGLGLFASALLSLSQSTGVDQYRAQAMTLLDHLRRLSSKGYTGACWGYPFDWQSRALFAPRGTPTVVATAFVAHAFLDAYTLTKEQRDADVARSACEFIMQDLHQTREQGTVCFSYTPFDHLQVHNANLLGAGLLARVARLTGEERLTTLASQAVAFTTRHQLENGAWYYGTASHHRWIDHFHTGFNLETLLDYADHTGRTDLAPSLLAGLAFYTSRLFAQDRVPKYYHDRVYPVDIHSCAQAIIIFTRFNKVEPGLLNRAVAVARWTLDHMRDREGFFYFQRRRFWTNRLSYMRWSQAWMMRALSHLLSALVTG